MLIGIDASRANLNHKSGPEWYSYYLIRWLAKLDSRNQYILYTDKPLTGGLLDLTTEQYIEDENGTSRVEIDSHGFQAIKSPFGNFRAKVLRWPYRLLWTQGRMSLEMIFHRPDILFIPAHVLPLIHPRKSIVTIHDIGYEDINSPLCDLDFDLSPSRRKSLINFLLRLVTFRKYKVSQADYLRWSTQFAIRKARRIIVASDFTRKNIEQFFKGPMEKIRIIPQGYNKSLYRKIDDQESINKVLVKYGIEKPYLFYIGRIERKKNIPALIEAFAILKENDKSLKHKLVMVGDASFGYDEINYAISEFELEDDVLMPGWVKETDIPFLYNGADAFIFPSNYEGFGIPLLQAMACGVPIATSDIASIPEVVGNAALLFNPKYVLPIAEAMAKVISDDKVRERLVKEGFERVKGYSWQKTAEETLREINSLR